MMGKFNAYDFIAVVIPGMFFIWALGAFSKVLNLEDILPKNGDLAETSILIVQGYILGLLLQGISQHLLEHVVTWFWGGLPSDRMLLPQDSTFPNDYKQNLRNLIRNKFNLSVRTDEVSQQELDTVLRDNHAAFRLCYRSIEKLAEAPAVFNAQYGLFRCLLAMFGLLSLIELVMLGRSYMSGLSDISPHIVNIVIFAIGGFISYLRMEKRAQDFSRSVYDLFYSHFSEK